MTPEEREAYEDTARMFQRDGWTCAVLSVGAVSWGALLLARGHWAGWLCVLVAALCASIASSAFSLYDTCRELMAKGEKP